MSLENFKFLRKFRENPQLAIFKDDISKEATFFYLRTILLEHQPQFWAKNLRTNKEQCRPYEEFIIKNL